MNSSNNKCFEFGPFLLDGKERFLLRDGQQVTLTPKAFETLLLLVENSGHVLTKEEMVSGLWPDTFVGEANLTNNISILRKALGDDSESQHYIKTVPRLGYRFVAAVRTARPVPTSESNWSSALSKKRRTVLALTTTVALLLLIAGGMIIRTRLSRASQPTLPFRERDWVLIASFENRTGEPLFDGTIESALERELSNSRFVNVISPERAGDVLRLMKMPPKTRIDAALGREVCLRDGGIRALVSGRVEKLGTTYVMSVSLLDPFRNQAVASRSEQAANQESLWPAIRRLSNWTRETLGEALPSIQQSNASLEKVTTPSLRALQLYTEAMPLLDQTNWGAAENVLRQAIIEDREFASAYIMLAHAIKNQGKPEKEWGPPSQRAFDLAQQTSERERYFIQGSYYQRFLATPPDYLATPDSEKAVAAYEALVRQYPYYFWGQWNLGWAYYSLGRWQEMTTQFAKAAELRPNNFWVNRMAAWNLLQRDMNDARRVVDRTARTITPDLATTHPDEVVWIQLFAVHDFWARDGVEAALQELDHWAQTIDSREGQEKEILTMYIANCYLAFGKTRAAEEFFKRLPEKNLERISWLAESAFAVGDKASFRKHIAQLKPGGLVKALMLARAGFPDEAQKLVSQRKKEPSSNTLFVQTFIRIVEGEIALARGRTGEGIALLEESVPNVRWNSSSVFFTESVSLADAFERQGDPQKSIQVLERASQAKAIAYDNTGSTGQYWLRVQWRLAQLYRKVGRVEEAQKIKADLSKMLAQADPEHPLLIQLRKLNAMTDR